MEQINRSVKAGQFSTTLATHIFRLYGFLKHVGEHLEQTHKSKFNFFSVLLIYFLFFFQTKSTVYSSACVKPAAATPVNWALRAV